jgi:thermitase
MKLFTLLMLVFSLDAFSGERLIIKLKEGVQIESLGINHQTKNLFGNVWAVFIEGQDKAILNNLENNPAIEFAEREGIAKRELPTATIVENVRSTGKGNSLQLNDPMLSRQWALQAASSYGMSVVQAHASRTDRPREEIIVAVVDTGLDVRHEDIPVWQNQDEIAANGIDDDNNGYIDDVNGINTLVRDSNNNATVDITDGHGHGTHVSGSIGAIQNNGKGIAGVAKNVKIMGIRTVPNSSDERDVDVIEAFIYAAKNGAKIINCSFGKDHNEGGLAVQEAIDHIGKEYGVLVVAAAGNSTQNIDSRPAYPASFNNENLLVVASTSNTGGMSYFSNFGLKNVDVAAPGSNILSSMPGNRYGNMSGTSMASPNTAGVAAEVLSQNPDLGPVELKELLMNSVVKVSSFQSKIKSGGRVDLDQALNTLD